MQRARGSSEKSSLNCRCVLAVGGLAVILLRIGPEPRRSAPAHGSEVWGVCLRVHAHWPVYVRREEDLLFLERRYCVCWRNSVIRRAKGQCTITLPRRT